MAETPADKSYPTTPNTHPPAIWFFFWGEFAERASYYGMRAILFLYMTRVLRFDDGEAAPLYASFKMACYFLPLVGGYIADRWLGRYWTIVGFSVPYVIGQFILGFSAEKTSLYIALVLLAMGSGVIKPNISTLMGQTYDQKRPGHERLRSSAFLWFYLSVNIGALISQFSLPLVRDMYIGSHLTQEQRSAYETAKTERGESDISKFASEDVVKSAYAIAFQLPAWLMLGALSVFALGKKTYAVEHPEHHELTTEQRQMRWQTLTRLFGIFALVVIFWFGYEHNDSLWVAFNRDYVDLKLPFTDKVVAPDQLQFLNALFVITFVPILNFVFTYFDPQVRVFTPMRKVLGGFLLTAAAIAIMSAAGYLVQGHVTELTEAGKVQRVATEKVSVWWPAIAYVVLTLGEVLLYGTMLELAYAAAPKSMKGFVTACFLVTNTIGNFINVLWTPMYGGSLTGEVSPHALPPGPFFGITAGIVFGAALLFIFVGKQFERSRSEATAAGLT